MRKLCSLLGLALLLGACSDERPPVAATVEFRLLTFNIEYGGAHVSFDNVVEAIRRSRADIVGIQEAEGNMPRLAEALGWNYDRRNYVLSRFPVYEPPRAEGRYVLIEVRPGQVIVLANLHLPSDPYGPDMLRDGASVADVLAVERSVRVPKLMQVVDALPELLEQSIPTFVTGDFNTPAHTDWTAEMVGERPFLNSVFEWPVSLAMVAADFTDAWRALYPDPKTKPGLTWWAGRPPLAMYAPGENDAQDRIDLIWYAGPAEVVSSEIVGEEGGPDVTFSVSPWPSDHRGVVSGFKATPAPLPVLLTTDRRVYQQGEDILVRFNTGNVPADVALVDMADGSTRTVFRPDVSSGEKVIAAENPGHFGIGLAGAAANEQREFWVLVPNAKPAVDVMGQRFDVGTSIPLQWHNAPGHRNDYVAIFRIGTPHGSEDIAAWAYTGARPHGSMLLGAATTEVGWPLPPGEYSARLLLDDGFQTLAESVRFVVASDETFDLDGEPL